MTFTLADELLNRQMAGEVNSPAARHLGLRLVRFARGVAVYEMPLRRHACDPVGRVENGVLTALAEAAMTAAARTAVADGDLPPDAVATRGLSAEFVSCASIHETDALRAEAIVMRRVGPAMHVAADVLCDGRRIASFSATCSTPLEAEVAA
jgi:uncharacterized protein (TIGR00369 family)